MRQLESSPGKTGQIAMTKGEAGNKGCGSRIGHGADCVVPVAVEVMTCEVHS